MRIIKIKNNTLAPKTWCGQVVESLEYFTLEPTCYIMWGNNPILLTDIANGEAIVNDGDLDITNVSQAINYLKGDPNFRENIDNRLNVHETSRALGTVTQWTSKLDDPSSPEKIGGGQLLLIEHEIGDATEQFIYGTFNAIENRTYIHEGTIQFSNAKWDTVDVYVIPKTTSVLPGTGEGFRLYGGYLLVPEVVGPGYGDEVVIDGGINLVEVIREEPHHQSRVGWWDADYDSETHTFSNIVPNLSMSGQFNIFTLPIDLDHFVDSHLMSGTTNGPHLLQSADSVRIGHNLEIKIKATTRGEDHDWSCGVCLTLHREKIV